jgi:glycosyltransferase involved in cell wall biosynthesis
MTQVSSSQKVNGKSSYRNSCILVCIPAYNEASNIGNIIQKAKEFCTEVVVYDDGSTDRTREIAEEAGAVVVGRKINRGYGAAIRELFRVAVTKEADIMVTLDSDGQHDPSQIPSLLKPVLDDECDIVIGSRFIGSLPVTSRIPKYRDFGIRTITKFAQAATHSHLTDAQSGFRAYNKEAIARMTLHNKGMSVSTEILIQASENDLRIGEVPVTISYDIKGGSTHNPISHGLGVLMNVIQYISLRHPLLFYGLPGIILLIAAAFFTSYALDLFSSTRYISTNMIIVSIGLSVVGVVLLATGAIVYTLVALFRGRT